MRAKQTDAEVQDAQQMKICRKREAKAILDGCDLNYSSVDLGCTHLRSRELNKRRARGPRSEVEDCNPAWGKHGTQASSVAPTCNCKDGGAKIENFNKQICRALT